MNIYSWGSNSHGQLGQKTNSEEILLPVPVVFNVEPKLITGGGKHTILLSSNGDLFSCGDNDKGQLGKDLRVKSSSSFIHVSVPVRLKKVCCGWDFNLALTENDEVYAWGSNSYGQLGLSTNKVKEVNSPTKVFEGKALDVGAGLRHSAVVSSEGLVYTSGSGRKGQLGLESKPSSVDQFTQVKNIANCQEISCGECHCIAKTASKEVYSWGNNKHGQLGLDPVTTPSTATPIRILIIADTTTLFCGWAHNFVLTEKGKLLNWGRNDFGQLGEEREMNWRPEFLNSVEKIKQASLGSHHSMVLSEQNEVFTWGWNEHGSCGNECCTNVKEPYKLKNFSKVKLIGCGAAHSFLFT